MRDIPPIIDHGLLSPSGRVSKRARDAALARDQERINTYWAKRDVEYRLTPEAQGKAAAQFIEGRLCQLRSRAAMLTHLRSFRPRERIMAAELAIIAAEIADLESTCV